MDTTTQFAFLEGLLHLFGQGRARTFQCSADYVLCWRPLAYPFNTKFSSALVSYGVENSAWVLRFYISKEEFVAQGAYFAQVTISSSGVHVSTGLHQQDPGVQEVLRVLRGEIYYPPVSSMVATTLSHRETVHSLHWHFGSVGQLEPSFAR